MMNQFTKRSIAALITAAGVSIIVVANISNDQSDKPSNILYIMADDHMAPMIGNNIETPNIDRIAKDGVRFVTNLIADSSDEESQQSYPKLLQEAGYTTAIIGKWYLNSAPTGFDHWAIMPGQGDYYNSDFQINSDEIVKSGGYVTNVITDMCVEWLDKERDRDRPFCLLMHHKAPHRNWMSDTTYLELYEDRVFDQPDTLCDDVNDIDLLYDLKMYHYNFDSELKQPYDRAYGRMNREQRAAWDRHYNAILEELLINKPTGKELEEWKFQRYMRDYAKTIKSLDDSVGVMLDYLDANDLLDNTLVVYTSDRGLYMCEESLNRPLLVKLPKKYNRRGEIEQMIQNIDCAPTLLELVGVKISEELIK